MLQWIGTVILHDHTMSLSQTITVTNSSVEFIIGSFNKNTQVIYGITFYRSSKMQATYFAHF
jgi:hypothetical protein